MKTLIYKSAIIIVFLLSATTFSSRSQTSIKWGKQFGTDKEEYSMNHVIDKNGDIYVCGKTMGDMDGKNSGKNDGFISKVDSLGNFKWTKQFGTDGDEDTQWSAIDNTGCIYITGSTTGVLKDKNFGKEDIFLVKYNPDGKMLWAKQFGTDSTDIGKGIYADNKGFVYITGLTTGKLGKSSFGKSDGFIMKLDRNGNQLFTTQFGTEGDDSSISITGDNDSNIYVCGNTWGDMGAKNKGFIDVFTGQFTNDGNLVRYNQFGSDGFDIVMNLKVDAEKNMYVVGSTSG
ncbi:MAG TPA: SBBP repeat-containing protein, partial [Prolixibacteraceae bacterium]